MENSERKLLVTTALSKTWGNSERILYLGEWCKKYSKKHTWEFRSFITKSWHWKDRKKLLTDHDYLADTHEMILKKLIPKLNYIHGVNYSSRYWRILIAPWLLTYIPIVWDRWESVRLIGKEKILLKTIIIKHHISRPIADDGRSAIDMMSSNDVWNYLLYCEIFNTQKIPTIELIREDVTFEKKTNFPKRKGYRSHYLKSIAKLFDNIARKFWISDEYLFLIYKSCFSMGNLFKLSFKIRQVPRIYNEFEKEFQYGNVQMPMREMVKEDLSHSIFEKFLCKQIFLDMPKAYVEGYKELALYCKSLPNSRVIMTAGAHMSNEVFKLWTAKQLENGSVLIVSEHGGSLPASTGLFDHEEKISDKKITWTTPLSESQIQILPSRLLHFKVKSSNELIVLIGLEHPRYSYRCQEGVSSSLVLDDFNQKVAFINLLDDASRRFFKVRPYPDQGWSTRDRYADIYGQGIITANIDKPLIKDYSKAKLIICSYPETTFSEAMISSVPTILLYTKEYWNFRPSYKDLIDELCYNNIIHSDPVSAAKFVNSIQSDPSKWWEKESTKIARENFFNLCCKISNDPIKEWADFLYKIKE